MLRSFQGFRSKKDIYFYEEEVQVSNDGAVMGATDLSSLENNLMVVRILDAAIQSAKSKAVIQLF